MKGVYDMPIRDSEKFLVNFLAETKVEAERLYEKYIKTIGRLADRYTIFVGVDKKDLIQEGIIGLARANRDFEKGRSKDFTIFAIYKIKDAMREFVTSQASDIKVPQYIKDAVALIRRLKKVMESVDVLESCSLLGIWDISKIYESNKDVADKVKEIKESIRNLADRSCTTTEELIERAEMAPSVNYEIIDRSMNNLSENIKEEELIHQIATKRSIENLKEYLTKDEYQLLVDHYVYGKTVRDLEKELGIKASSVTIRIHSIIRKLKQRKNTILCYESDKDPKKTG